MGYCSLATDVKWRYALGLEGKRFARQNLIDA